MRQGKDETLQIANGSIQREVKTFGDLVTFDFVTASGDHEVEGRYALIIRDIYTGIIMAYPTARRDTDSVVRAIKHFCGRRKIKQVYSDDGPELINACVELKLNHDLSLPGWAQKNSLAERTNQFIIDQTSACLVHAGLPTCYWVQAITTLCHLMNIEEVNGSSAWMRLHGEEFKGEKIPFKGEETHMARAHGICVEKHSQLPVGDPKRKFKGRGVLLGNQVKNQSFEAAMFQDLGNSPASFEASHWADFLGCHDGWDVQMADAVQAYIQATLRGTPCWIELPPEAVPSECRWDKYRRPVVPLRKALYGHPDAGTFWEQHCDESVRAVGFEPIGEEWPSVYIHEKLQLVLVVYVDDFKMAGPQKNLAQGWSMLRTRLKIEPETGLDMYLGCNQSKGNVTLGNGHRVTTVTYDMEQFLRSCVDRYLEVAGDVKLNKVVTPELHEETKNHVSRKPARIGVTILCPPTVLPQCRTNGEGLLSWP